jgi:hypothetical protein
MVRHQAQVARLEAYLRSLDPAGGGDPRFFYRARTLLREAKQAEWRQGRPTAEEQFARARDLHRRAEELQREESFLRWQNSAEGKQFEKWRNSPEGKKAFAEMRKSDPLRTAERVEGAEETGTIYRVPGEFTTSGKDYIGRHNKPTPQQTRRSDDGRDRTQAEVVDRYDPNKPMEGRIKEQEQMDVRGGVQKLDNRRNEIAPEKWEQIKRERSDVDKPQ